MHRPAALGLGLALSACAADPPAPALPPAATDDPPGAGATIAGVLTHHRTHKPLSGALVILQCACLPGQREVQSDAGGIYRFRRLPPGHYTVQVLYARAIVNKSMQLPPDARLRSNFTINPDFKICIILDPGVPRFTSGHAWVLVGDHDLPLKHPRP